MNNATLFSFWVFSLAFVFTPGADWAYAISTGIHGRGVMAAVLGLLVGYVGLTLIVAAGFGMIVASNRAAMTILTVLGALYLCWMGIALLRNPPTPYSNVGNAPSTSRARLFFRGTLVSGLNPKAFLFFLAFLPPWTNAKAAWSISTQITALGLLYTASCSVVYSLVGLGANAALGTRPAAARAIGRMSGLMMILLAVLLMCREFTSHN